MRLSQIQAGFDAFDAALEVFHLAFPGVNGGGEGAKLLAHGCQVDIHGDDIARAGEGAKWEFLTFEEIDGRVVPARREGGYRESWYSGFRRAAPGADQSRQVALVRGAAKSGTDLGTDLGVSLPFVGHGDGHASDMRRVAP